MSFFYSGNLYKWAYACRGCSVMWVNPLHHSNIRSLISSFPVIYANGDFRSYFVYNGTNDRSMFYTAKAGIDFLNKHGGVVCIKIKKFT